MRETPELLADRVKYASKPELLAKAIVLRLRNDDREGIVTPLLRQMPRCEYCRIIVSSYEAKCDNCGAPQCTS